jgi:hypothetical protein
MRLKMSFDYDFPEDFLKTFKEPSRCVTRFKTDGTVDVSENTVHISGAGDVRICHEGECAVEEGDYIVEFDEIPTHLELSLNNILNGFTLRTTVESIKPKSVISKIKFRK